MITVYGYYQPYFLAHPCFTVVATNRVGNDCMGAVTLVSFFLVIFEHENAANRKAGFVYIIMAHIWFRISCRCLFHYVCLCRYFYIQVLMISGILAHKIPGIYKNIVFFGNCRLWNKARYLPLHLWLPHKTSRCPKQCLDSYVRRHDQDGYLWLLP